MGLDGSRETELFSISSNKVPLLSTQGSLNVRGGVWVETPALNVKTSAFPYNLTAMNAGFMPTLKVNEPGGSDMHLKVILLVRDMPKLWRPSLKKRLKRACDCCLSYFGAKPLYEEGK